MIVYILTDNVNLIRLERLKYAVTISGYKYQVVTNLQNLDIDKDIIIASNVSCQFPIFQKYVKQNIYGILDDKINFYNYLKTNPKITEDSGVHLIPYYDKSYTGPSITQQFLIKQRNGWGSKFNTIVNDNVYNLIKKYSNTHQIQDLMDVKHILGVSLSVLHGKILGVYTYKSFTGLTPEMNAQGFDAQRENCIRYKEVRKFLKKLIKKINYQGIAEFEFIIDKQDKIYIMECNPRVCDSLRINLYVDHVIKRYIVALQTRKFDGINIDDEKLWK